LLGLFNFDEMKKIQINTTFKKLLADVYTPVGIYLRLRDRFRDTVLLESTDYHTNENSYSIIGINAIGGIEISDAKHIEFKKPGQPTEKILIDEKLNVPDYLWSFMQSFELLQVQKKPVSIAQSMFGYTAYDAIQFFDTLALTSFNKNIDEDSIPLMRYRLYQYVIVIDHFKDELYICENNIDGIQSEVDTVENLIKSKDVPTFPFNTVGTESSNLTDEAYLQMVQKGIVSCQRGDVFQIVLSRKFEQKFTGDEFNVYRALRTVNPSPYLFYFDYGDYKLIGSSPESQLIINNGKAIVHPIAGTFKRTGNDEADKLLAEKLLLDEKENAEHVMLVDLARNDLSRMCSDVQVTQYKKINYYSHVIHLVSEVTAQVSLATNPFKLLATTFPAGTLSGAPKFKAMQLINGYEKSDRGYYGGAIGSIGFDGNINHAIMIRTFLSKQNTLICQAGAGVVVSSQPQLELEEVNNKLGALKTAIQIAKTI
jgi:anthranilate synthase component I